MGRKSSYIFKAATAALALSELPGIGHQEAHAALMTNADFTFDSVSNAANTSSVHSVSYLADIGTGTAFGSHAATATFSFQSGNGSFNALSANVWTAGDYWQFSVPTSTLTGIQVSFDQIGSNTGPRDFVLTYSTDGISFSTVDTAPYSLVATPGWSSGSSQAAYNHS